MQIGSVFLLLKVSFFQHRESSVHNEFAVHNELPVLQQPGVSKMQVTSSSRQRAGCRGQLRGMLGGARLQRGSVERKDLAVGNRDPSHWKPHMGRHFPALAVTSFPRRSAILVMDFLQDFSKHQDVSSHPLLNQLQKQKMSQNPLGLLVGYLSKDTVLYIEKRVLSPFFSFILLLICKVVSCSLLALSHTVRIKKGRKKSGIQGTISRGNYLVQSKHYLFF